MAPSIQARVAVALSVLCLAACGSAREAPPPLPNGLGPPAAVSTAPAPVPSRGPTTVPRCRSADLRATVTVKASGGGSPRWTLTLTNVSGHSCRARGWVGLEAFNIKGKTATSYVLKVDRIGHATDIVIRSYESAHSILTRSTGGRCTSQMILGVIPPAESENHDMWPDFPNGSVCDGRMIVTALAAGTGITS